jgi:transcription initiation factor IIE alpha subunit
MVGEAELVLEIWSLIKGNLSASEKDTHAIRLLQIFEEHGVYSDELVDDLRGHDKSIDRALAELYDISDSDYEE